MGGRPRVVPAVVRSLARRAVHGPSERRIVHGVPGADPAAHGPHLPRRAAGPRQPELLAGSALADGLSREYTLEEIAIVTRAGPARLLGLSGKGHLGPGADADVTVYNVEDNVAGMFRTPRYVVKAGVLVVEEAQLRRAPAGTRLHVQPEFDRRIESGLRRYFDRYSTVSFDHYPVRLPGAPCAIAG